LIIFKQQKMKKLIILLMAVSIGLVTKAQSSADALQTAVNKLEKATTAKEFEALEKEFISLSASQKNNWLPYYYAALCNAKIGFLYQDDGDKIEPYSNRGTEQAATALQRLDTTKQKKELSEVYVVMSMLNRSKVFINPMTYGRKYGPVAERYLQEALRLDPQNPRALSARAWVKYHTPKLWGGDKDLAKQLATQSLQLLGQEHAQPGYPHWGKLDDEVLLQKMK
jgi:hypothetical protein